MMEPVNPVVIKKYGNRRLYNTTTSPYENVESLAGMAKRGENFIVYDAKSGDDITRSVLRHIVSEEEKTSDIVAGFRVVDDEIFTSFCHAREAFDVLIGAGRRVVEAPIAVL